MVKTQSFDKVIKKEKNPKLKYGILKKRSGLRKVKPYCNSLDTQSLQGSSSQFVVIIVVSLIL